MPESITLPPLCLRFGDGEGYSLDDLHRRLQQQRTTAPLIIRRPADLLLRSDGTVGAGYRFTPNGLSSLCQRIGPGLSQWIMFLAGVRDVINAAPAVDPNPDLAVRMLNESIRHCFSDRLEGHRLVIDPSRNAIEGLVGPKYAFLSNQDWLIQCQQFIARSAPDAEFFGAALFGRRFLLRYASRNVWFTDVSKDGTRDEYRLGWNFSNSETGEAAVRVGMLVISTTGAASLRKLDKQAHTAKLRQDNGAALLAKMRASLDKVNVEVIRGDIVRLRRRRLPISTEVDELRKDAHRLSVRLGKTMPRSLARSIASLTLSAAATPQRELVAANARFTDLISVPTERSYYHLYHALTTRARQCLPDEQERVEALAYLLLRGRFSPVSSSPT